MQAVKGTYLEDGRLVLREPVGVTGPVDVLVVFPDVELDPWAQIVADEEPRPKLAAAGDDALAEYRAGRTKPLDVGQL
jgi:hypothetical protein